jgi:peptide/nickel transport system permease protein
MLKRCLSNKKFTLSAAIIMPIILIALVGPLIAPHDPIEMNTRNRFAGSSLDFPMGTDEYGRCTFSRLLCGVRPSIVVSFSGAGLAFVIGSTLGITAGFAGGAVGNLIMRMMEVVLCFPSILLAMAVVAMWGPGVRNLIVVVMILYTPHFARIANSSTLRVAAMEYVESEIAIGARISRVLGRIIFPNVLSPLVIQFSLTVSSAILLESGLSFLGLGVQPPQASLGQMIGDAKAFISVNVAGIFWPSLALCLTILAINLMGDALRDLLDPRLRENLQLLGSKK